MRSSVEWSDRIVDKDGVKYPIYSLTFNPEGSQLLASCGTQILVYNCQTGDLINTLKAHKDTIYALDYSPDGKRFASGGADKTVIIWHSGLEGMLKYQHTEPIQAITHNPLTNHVTSVTSGEFGIWSPDQKSVNKFKAPSKITCCSWTRDGQFLALGLYTGSVTVRNRAGEELIRIDRSTHSPVWSITWNQYGADEPLDILAITDWSQELSFYQLNGKPVGKPRALGFDPCTVSYYQKRYLLIGGSDRKVSIWSSDGVQLGVVGEVDGWVWCSRADPKLNRVAVGSNDGSITIFRVTLSTVHGLYKNRYAYRENMSDVVVQDLFTNRRVRIKCRDHVKKVAICRNQLAVQLSDRLVIYDQVSQSFQERVEWGYQIRERIKIDMECNLLVITSKCLLVCLDRNLHAFSFSGERMRQWRLDSLIRYIKVVGGPSGKEGLLVGLKSGQVYLVHVDNPFPILIYKHQAAIRCLDLSRSRSKLAIVDEHGQCILYDLLSRHLIAQESGASAVAWNADYEDMVCYSGNGYLNIKASQFPTHRQRMQGFVVGFMGSKIFCLTQSSVVAVDVPQAVTMDRLIAAKQFPQAYETACLGVTEDEWQRLAMSALENYQLETAKKAFAWLRDFKYLELIAYLESLKGLSAENGRNLCLAYYHAYLGQFKEAAALFRKAGEPQKAINMFADLNMWDSATRTATETSADKTDLLKRKAQIQQDKNDLLSAAKTFEEMGDYLQAIAIYSQLKLWIRMAELARSLNKIEIRALEKCAEHLLRNQQLELAVDVLKKLDDIKRLLDIYIELQRWDDAMQLVEMYPNMAAQINLPYAHWLAANEQYREAQEYFRRAGRLDLSIGVLKELAECAVSQNRFQDAAHYYWALSQEYHLHPIIDNTTNTALVPQSSPAISNQESYDYYQLLALLYFAYGPVHAYSQDPFSQTVPTTLLNQALFVLKVLHSGRVQHKRFLGTTQLPGISTITLLISIGKLSQQLGAYKLARFILDRLYHKFALPSALVRQDIARSLLIARGRPFTDVEQLSIVCWHCGITNPLIDRSVFDEAVNEEGAVIDGDLGTSDQKFVADGCLRCGHQFIRSLYTFDTLPLEEFRPAAGISQDEAIVLLQQQSAATPTEERHITEEVSEKVQRLQLHDDKSDDADRDEERWEKSLQLTLGRRSLARNKPIVTMPTMDRKAMESISPKDVFIINSNNGSVSARFFKIIAPGCMALSKCEHCHQFFHTEDLEYLALQTPECPLCRNPWNSNELFGSAVNLAAN